jgi:hypothetical protein
LARSPPEGRERLPQIQNPLLGPGSGDHPGPKAAAVPKSGVRIPCHDDRAKARETCIQGPPAARQVSLPCSPRRAAKRVRSSVCPLRGRSRRSAFHGRTVVRPRRLVTSVTRCRVAAPRVQGVTWSRALRNTGPATPCRWGAHPATRSVVGEQARLGRWSNGTPISGLGGLPKEVAESIRLSPTRGHPLDACSKLPCRASSEGPTPRGVDGRRSACQLESVSGTEQDRRLPVPCRDRCRHINLGRRGSGNPRAPSACFAGYPALRAPSF